MANNQNKKRVKHSRALKQSRNRPQNPEQNTKTIHHYFYFIVATWKSRAAEGAAF